MVVPVGWTEFCRQNPLQSPADLTPLFQITNWVTIAHIFCTCFLLCYTTNSCRWEVPELLAGFQSQDVHFPFQCRLEANMAKKKKKESVGKHSRHLLVCSLVRYCVWTAKKRNQGTKSKQIRNHCISILWYALHAAMSSLATMPFSFGENILHLVRICWMLNATLLILNIWAKKCAPADPNTQLEQHSSRLLQWFISSDPVHHSN